MATSKQYLRNTREIMQAFLDGKKLQNSNYYDNSGEYYLYLSDTGCICEEDGAGAKINRVPMCMRNDELWWILE